MEKIFFKLNLGSNTLGITFVYMALIQKPTKLSPLVVDSIKKDVRQGVFPNDNFAINEILKKHYGIPSEFQATQKLKKTKNKA